MFFFNDTATTEIYTLSLHDALPICSRGFRTANGELRPGGPGELCPVRFVSRTGSSRTATVVSASGDRKSTRLNSSHANISYAVFCLQIKNAHHLPPYSGDHIVELRS